VRQLAPAVLIGGLTGFALIGPVSHLFPGWAAVPAPASMASVSPPPTPSSTTTSTTCYVRGGPLLAAPQPTPTASAPSAIWVNAPLGVNLRTGPSVSSTRLATLPQGTRAPVLSQQAGPDGALWYQVQPSGLPTGWVHGAYVVPMAIHTVTTGEGWSLMLPDGYTLTRTGPGTVEVRADQSAPLPFLEIAESAPGTPSLPAPVPAELRHDVPWVTDHVSTVDVWESQSTMTVSRAAVDTCLVPGAASRADGGWSWVSALSASSTNHQYSFLFISDQPADRLVTQVLASLYLS
jgi:Bacterial SH3 domain